MFLEPMYANPLPNLEKKPKAKPFILEYGKIVAEEKYDGIRLVSEISSRSDKLFINKGVTCWSRYGNVNPVGHVEHVEEELAKLPNCYVDGELIAPGKRSYGTMTLANNSDLVYYIFDILRHEDDDLTAAPYYSRRGLLVELLKNLGPAVQLAPATLVNSWDEVFAVRDEVYARDGEGLILKHVDSPYMIGKRPKNTWTKIKKLFSECFMITGFEPSRGEKNYRGPYGMTKLIDKDGIETQVKTLNDAQCRIFEEQGKLTPHPSIGRKLWCEYQERTPDGKYRHIRWDHWD